jgi:hypothetical protein
LLLASGFAPLVGFIIRYQLDSSDNWARESIVLTFDIVGLTQN